MYIAPHPPKSWTSRTENFVDLEKKKTKVRVRKLIVIYSQKQKQKQKQNNWQPGLVQNLAKGTSSP